MVPGPIFVFIAIRKVALNELIKCAFSVIPKREVIGFFFFCVCGGRGGGGVGGISGSSSKRFFSSQEGYIIVISNT